MSSVATFSGRVPLQQVQYMTCGVLVLVSHPGGGRVLVIQLDEPVRRRVPLLGGDRPRHQHGLSPAAHPPRIQDHQAVRIFSRGLRHADARRRADLLGRHASQAPSALRPGARSAHAAGQRLLGAHGLDPLRRGAPQRHGADVEVRARPGEGPVLSLADDLSLGAADGARLRRCSRSAAGRWSTGRSSCASSSACTRPGW